VVLTECMADVPLFCPMLDRFLKQLAWYEQMSCASTRILLTARRLSTIAAPAYTAEALLPNARGVIW